MKKKIKKKHKNTYSNDTTCPNENYHKDQDTIVLLYSNKLYDN